MYECKIIAINTGVATEEEKDEGRKCLECVIIERKYICSFINSYSFFFNYQDR